MHKVVGVALAGAVGASFTATLFAAGCTSSNTASSTSDAQAYCFVTPDETAGAACHVEGLVCTPGYQCGSFSQNAVCTCTSGTFQCVDATGQPFSKGTPPACVPYPPGKDKCPDPTTSTAAQLEGTKCNTPGTICQFPTTCPPDHGVIPYDVCQCVGNGSGGLAYSCEPGCGTFGDGAVPDIFVPPDSSGDDGSDGATE